MERVATPIKIQALVRGALTRRRMRGVQELFLSLCEDERELLGCGPAPASSSACAAPPPSATPPMNSDFYLTATSDGKDDSLNLRSTADLEQELRRVRAQLSENS